MTQGKIVYTLNETAELLGVSRAYVNRLVLAGKLRVARIGQRTVRVTDEALRVFLRSQEHTGRVRPLPKGSPGARWSETFRVGRRGQQKEG